MIYQNFEIISNIILVEIQFSYAYNMTDAVETRKVSLEGKEKQ